MEKDWRNADGTNGRKKNEYIIIEGNFNLRIEEEGGFDELREMGRNSKDKVIGNAGRKLVNLVNG